MATIIDENELRHSGFYWRSYDGVQALVCSALEADGFTNGFSTRLGGVSAMPQKALNLAGFNEDTAQNILENRRRFLKLFPGIWEFAGCWQVHGTDVRVVHQAADARPAENSVGETIYCDAVISNTHNVLAGVKTADCVALLFADAKTGAFAAGHAGWRGTLSGIATHVLHRLEQEYKTVASDVRVAIGPSAAGCCYEVGSEVIENFKASFPDIDSFVVAKRDGHARIDLAGINRRQLETAGVYPERIHTAPLCTMCRTDLFFSYRKEKSVHGKVGRLMAVIGRPTDR